MSEQIVSQLKSDDPNQRKKAISVLARSGDRRALKTLSQIYKSDPDPAVREHARKAGVHIQQRQEAASAAVEAAAAGPSVPSFDAVLKADPAAVPGAARDPEKAQRHHDMAFEYHVRGDDAHAALELGSALYLDYSWSEDVATANLAAELSGLPPQRAVQVFADPKNWQKLTERHGGVQGRATGEQPGGLGRLFIYAVVGIVIIAIAVAAANQFPLGEAIAQIFEGIFGPTS